MLQVTNGRKNKMKYYAGEHNKNLPTIGKFPRIPTKSESIDWSSRDTKISKAISGPHHIGRK